MPLAYPYKILRDFDLSRDKITAVCQGGAYSTIIKSMVYQRNILTGRSAVRNRSSRDAKKRA